MRALRVVPRIAVLLGLLAVTGMTGCSALHFAAPTPTAPASPAASASAAAASPASAPPGLASAPAVTSSAAPASSGAVQNLIVSTAVRSELLTAYAALRGIPASDATGLPGSVYYAYVPATGTYWAKATWEPVSSDPQAVQVGFQDGASDGFYKKTGNGPWQVRLGGEPEVCEMPKFFPAQVLAAWSLSTTDTPPAGC